MLHRMSLKTSFEGVIAKNELFNDTSYYMPVHCEPHYQSTLGTKLKKAKKGKLTSLSTTIPHLKSFVIYTILYFLKL